jgi:hypothetical protein
MLFATNHPARRRRRREYRVVEFRGAPAIPGPSTTSSLRRGPTTSDLPTASRRRRTLCCGRGVPPLGSRAGDTGHGVLGRLAVSQFLPRPGSSVPEEPNAGLVSLSTATPTYAESSKNTAPAARKPTPYPDSPPRSPTYASRWTPSPPPCAATKKKSAAYENQKPTKCTLNS